MLVSWIQKDEDGRDKNRLLINMIKQEIPAHYVNEYACRKGFEFMLKMHNSGDSLTLHGCRYFLLRTDNTREAANFKVFSYSKSEVREAVVEPLQIFF